MNYLVGDQQVSDYTEGGEDYEVHVRAAPEFRTTLAGLKELTVPSSTLGSVPISNVVDFEQNTGPASNSRRLAAGDCRSVGKTYQKPESRSGLFRAYCGNCENAAGKYGGVFDGRVIVVRLYVFDSGGAV
jgi:hypothetical protein